MHYLDMYFPTENDIPDFGTIRLINVGPIIGDRTERDQYGKVIDMRLREYVLLSDDISKLQLINNAADGSKAIIVDTGKEYILAYNQWREWTGGNSDITWSHF